MLQPDYVLVLVMGWLKAWERYKGYVSDVGALPGIVVGIEAGLLRKDDSEVRGENYVRSKKRADFNLLLRQAEARGWLKRVETHPSQPRRVTEDLVAGRPWDIGWLFKDSTEVHNTVAEQFWSPDFCFWIVTPDALQDAQVLAKMREQAQKAPLGFRGPGSADSSRETNP